MNENYLTIKEISEKYNVKENLIYSWISRNLIKTFDRIEKIGIHKVIKTINDSEFEILLIAFNLFHKKDLSFYQKIAKKQ